MPVSFNRILQWAKEGRDTLQDYFSTLDNPADISHALEILGSVKEPWVLDFIKPYLYHTHPMVREGAIYGMAERFHNGSLNAGAFLLEALNTPAPVGTSEETHEVLKRIISDALNV